MKKGRKASHRGAKKWAAPSSHGMFAKVVYSKVPLAMASGSVQFFTNCRSGEVVFSFIIETKLLIIFVK